MTVDDCFLLGKVSKIIGLEGKVSIHLSFVSLSELENWEPILISLNDVLVPFFLEEPQIQRGKYLVTFLENVSDDKEAQQLLGKEVYLPKANLPKKSGKDFYDFEIIGFTINDSSQAIGEIYDVVTTAGNVVAVLEEENGPLIPLHKDLISSIDREQKIIYMNLPDGLLDLYEDE